MCACAKDLLANTCRVRATTYGADCGGLPPWKAYHKVIIQLYTGLGIY